MAPEDLVEMLGSLVSRGAEQGATADWAVARSALLVATENDLSTVLREFFDDERVVRETRDSLLARREVSSSLKWQMAEALVFLGLDEEAAPFL